MTINKLPFLFVIATLLLLASSFILRTPGEGLNSELLIIAGYFAAAYWLLTIIMVATAPKLKPPQKRGWFIILISLPFIGGLLYQLVQLQSKKNAHRFSEPVVSGEHLFLNEQTAN